MVGNVWEWCSSLWAVKAIKALVVDFRYPHFGYPYDPTDGRENLEAPDDVHRVVRGGSWADDSLYTRCAVRAGDRSDWSRPVFQPSLFGFRSIGFRVCVMSRQD